MAYSIRSILCNKIGQVLLDGFSIGGYGPKPSFLLPFLKLSPKRSQNIEYTLDLDKFKTNSSFCFVEGADLAEWESKFIKNFQTDSSIKGAYVSSNEKKNRLNFIVNKENFTKEVINLVLNRPEDFWKSSALLAHKPLNVVVEFSSPNIAKPFHIGHLRSTLIGNFVCNLHEALGHKVLRLNYLGDWGVQFGFLKYGLNLKNISESDLNKNPMKTLFDLYVWINQEASKDPKIEELAKEAFALMENNDEEILNTWEIIRKISIDELHKAYRRLNITFDEYHGESMYRAKECYSVLHQMEEKGLIKYLNDGRKVYEVKPLENVTILKSDSVPLYITRDISAAISRAHKYKFDKMYYVVDRSQQKHFDALFQILKDLGHDWADRLNHIRFGRVLGMSTRKGIVLFLSDILNEAKENMLLSQASSRTTKVNAEENEHVTETMGISTVIVSLLKNSRASDITFDWEAAKQPKGDTGVKLQYAHCRLASLEEKLGMDINLHEEWDSSLLSEPEAVQLVIDIARFDEILLDSFRNFEASLLIHYLFKLCKSISKAWKVLPVKDAPKPISEARFKLFLSARFTLAAGLKILGILPLNKM